MRILNSEKTIESKENKYYYKVFKYTNEGYKCELYKKLWWVFVVKVHEEIFIKKLGKNSQSEMAFNTMFDYENTTLVD